jgi:hypothetical protein
MYLRYTAAAGQEGAHDGERAIAERLHIRVRVRVRVRVRARVRVRERECPIAERLRIRGCHMMPSHN